MNSRFDSIELKNKPTLINVKKYGRGREYQTWAFVFENQDELNQFEVSYLCASLFHGYGASRGMTRIIEGGKIEQIIHMSNSCD